MKTSDAQGQGVEMDWLKMNTSILWVLEMFSTWIMEMFA